MTIEKVIFGKGDSHTNDMRTVMGILEDPFRGLLGSIEQVRVIQVVNQIQLGKHFRDYAELYGVIGIADFILEDIQTRKRETYNMQTGNVLYIPPKVALLVEPVEVPLTIVCCSESHEREQGTHTYQF